MKLTVTKNGNLYLKILRKRDLSKIKFNADKGTQQFTQIRQ